MNPVHEEETIGSTSSTSLLSSLPVNSTTSTTISPTATTLHNLPLPFPVTHIAKKESPQHPTTRKTFANHQIPRSNYNLQIGGIGSPLNEPSKSKKMLVQNMYQNQTQNQNQPQSQSQNAANPLLINQVHSSKLITGYNTNIRKTESSSLPSVPLPPSPPQSNEKTKPIKSGLANIWDQTELDFSDDEDDIGDGNDGVDNKNKSVNEKKENINIDSGKELKYFQQLQQHQQQQQPVISLEDNVMISSHVNQSHSFSDNTLQSKNISLIGNNPRSRSESDLDCKYDDHNNTGCILPPPSTSPSFPLSLSRGSPANTQNDGSNLSDHDILETINQTNFFPQETLSPRPFTLEVAPIVPLEGQSHPLVTSDSSTTEDSSYSPKSRRLSKVNIGVQVSIEVPNLSNNKLENSNNNNNENNSNNNDNNNNEDNFSSNKYLPEKINEIMESENENSPNTISKKVLIAARETSLSYQLNSSQAAKRKAIFKACQQVNEYQSITHQLIN